MIGLDTNVLARYIVQDDDAQAAVATRLIETRCSEDSPGFVSQLVLAELVWVLGRGYRYSKEVVCDVLSKLLGAVELQIEDAANTRAALRAFEEGSADFSDYLIGMRAHAAGCETTFTFDRKAAHSGLHSLATG